MLIEHISISRAGVIHECQQKYKFKYHLKVIPNKPEAPWFVYGKFIHKVSEIYVKNKAQQDIYQIAADIINGKIEFEEIQKVRKLDSTYKNKIKTHLRSVEKITKEVGCDGHIEYEIKYDLDPPNNKLLVGFIDRLFFKDDKAFILDYKTTKIGPFRKTKETIKKDLQLRVYAFYIHEKFKIEPEKIHTGLYYLDDSKLITAKYTLPELIEAKESLKKDFALIENMNENSITPNVGSHCKRCDYEDVCPFYSAKRSYL